MKEPISFLYESVIINEMTQDVIDYINDLKGEDKPFNNIFGDKDRIVIPLQKSGEPEELTNLLKQGVKGYAGIDLDSKEVIRKIKLDPKYGKGSEKEQRVNIGKAIQSLNIDPEEKKKYLDWFARYKDNLKENMVDDEYSIVLSRNPIDVVRMSDHRNISSCHSKGGSYFQCAIQEALTGGGIAYLVRNDTIRGFGEDELQHADIFEDKDRWQAGSVPPPLARIRIRKLELGEDENEMAVPETRIYGDDSIPGFYESVLDFIKSKQSVTEDNIREWLDTSPYAAVQRGGSYQDNSPSDLVKSYFGTDTESYEFGDIMRNVGNVEHSDDSRQEYTHRNIAMGLDNRLSEIKLAIDPQLDHGAMFYDVSDAGEDEYYYYHGSQNYNFERDLKLTDDDYPEDWEDIEANDSYEVSKIHRGDLDTDTANYSDFIRKLETLMYPLEIVQFILTMEYLYVGLAYYAETTSYDPDDFRKTGRELIDIDSKYKDNLASIVHYMRTFGILASYPHDSDFSRFQAYEKETVTPWNTFEGVDDDQINNFTVKWSESVFRSKTPFDFDNQLFKLSKDQLSAFIKDRWGLAGELDDALKDYQSKYFEEPEPQEPHPEFPNFNKFFESFANVSDFDKTWQVASFNMTVPMKGYSGEGDSIYGVFELRFDKANDRSFAILDFFDANKQDITNIIRSIVAPKLKNELKDLFSPPNLPAVKKVYGNLGSRDIKI